jgi:cell division protein FtsZ
MKTFNGLMKKSIKIIGVGGAGINILNNLKLISKNKIEFWAINTDSKSLVRSKIINRIQLSNDGNGAGGNSVVARFVTEKSRELVEVIKGVDAIILLAGFGGGTGSGATPVIAKLSKSFGAQVFVVATMPFEHEGSLRKQRAKKAVSELQGHVDFLKVIENEVINKTDMDLATAFGLVDKVFRVEVEKIVEMKCLGFDTSN